jgi:cysteine desulfurase family protein (TIGR01976 family)
MAYDVAALRTRFPALSEGAAHFDGPGGSQVPDAVAGAVAAAMTAAVANRGRVTAAERRADAIVLAARRAVADLIGVDPGGVVFGRSMTALTYELSRALAKTWGPGDEVVVSRLDHDANIRPWLSAAAAAGARVRWAELDPATGELPLDAVAAVVGERTRLVALTGASNLIGTRPDVAAIAGLAHGVGALVYLDGVHLTPHAPVDVTLLGADFYAWSPYKLFGPHCGVVAAAPELLSGVQPDKLAPSSDAVPERFELGTLPYELLAGVSAAVDFLAGLGVGATRRERVLDALRAVGTHEATLAGRVEEALGDLPEVTLHSRAAERTPTLLLTFSGRAAGEVAAQLAAEGVNAPAGNFYALEASRALGLGDAGGLRVGISAYTDDHDVDRLLGALTRALRR